MSPGAAAPHRKWPYPKNSSSPPVPKRTTVRPACFAASETKYLFTPPTVGSFLATKIRSRPSQGAEDVDDELDADLVNTLEGAPEEGVLMPAGAGRLDVAADE